MLMGGVDVPSQLIQLGLIDEYIFLIYPTFGGKGKRLLENIELAGQLNLKLVEHKVFEAGSVLLRYVKG